MSKVKGRKSVLHQLEHSNFPACSLLIISGRKLNHYLMLVATTQAKLCTPLIRHNIKKTN